VVSRYPIVSDTPDRIGYIAVAVWIIRKKRSPVCLKPCLKNVPTKRTEIGSKNANNEYERRGVERRLYRRLSRYYQVPEGEKEGEEKEEKEEKEKKNKEKKQKQRKEKEEWTRPPLLVTGKHGDDHSTC